MGKRQAPADYYQLDLVSLHVRVWPLFGLNRLVKLRHRTRNGILCCDNVVWSSESCVFSSSNRCAEPYVISFKAPMSGVLGEPRVNAPGAGIASVADRFRDDGSEFTASYIPQHGQPCSVECSAYRVFDSAGRVVTLGDCEMDVRVAQREVILDAAAYLAAGYSIKNLWCHFESAPVNDRSALGGPPDVRGLPCVEKKAGLWNWRIDDTASGVIRLGWHLGPRDESATAKVVDLKSLATELSVEPRLTKDLHNFVVICHYFVAGYRSLHAIAPEMMTSRSALKRSLEAIEHAIGAEVIHRTKGRGLITVMPAGEAVLDWWSQFYMRWTPIAAPIG